ncbi:anaerobic ribonucleoside-triphosphate reductase activating protein [Staphylococcus simulans]|uniref:anaerobic ribonucleoside-triphosphate reductase activating protein n=1 Tax=Staphylococcus simulans TaxID=1286 RepID=UPI000D02A98E|nr:anaerobic ribonucleoside-triphosphate reductase activating protein [Staphylococcus simulans]AVO01428.1 anaerobic ribonucleoside-triphosphate reductase activating protein [Staphylococcus simulans]AVO04380.1 anaerobic ribonucleoside-triphosphate reductase activating protein [Staphylococcus simulans]AWG17976.1 anaerobic ribonucleoside-triphosphate reductase activating protein [Staphylococcus simulans]AWI00945.1 anaerobic ribonucleoside-triphosphate reductase activating protein [Staphylococcus s
MLYAQVETGQGYLAKIEEESFVDGEGVRCSVYVSGCPFACAGCYNVAAQKFKYGTPFTDEMLTQILDACAPDYIAGLSLLGGEPFCNIDIIQPLIEAFRARFGHTKTIWVWSGFMFENLKHNTKARKELLKQIDVLVDGPFVQQLYQPGLAFKGSLNQRVINVPLSLQTNTIIEI